MEAFMQKTFKTYMLLALIGMGIISTNTQAYNALSLRSSFRNLDTATVLTGVGALTVAAALLYYFTHKTPTEDAEASESTETQDANSKAAEATPEASSNFHRWITLSRCTTYSSFLNPTPVTATYNDHFPVLAPADSAYTQTAKHNVQAWNGQTRRNFTSYNDHFPVIS